MRYNNRKYFVVPFADVTSRMYTDSIETKESTLRRSKTGQDDAIFKIRGDSGSTIFGVYTEYSHEQMLAEVSKDRWIDKEE